MKRKTRKECLFHKYSLENCKRLAAKQKGSGLSVWYFHRLTWKQLQNSRFIPINYFNLKQSDASAHTSKCKFSTQRQERNVLIVAIILNKIIHLATFWIFLLRAWVVLTEWSPILNWLEISIMLGFYSSSPEIKIKIVWQHPQAKINCGVTSTWLWINRLFKIYQIWLDF